MNFFSTILFYLIVFLVITGCKQPAKKGQTLRDYDLDKPEKFFMPESLHEISGISFHKQHNDTVYAIQDEEGKLFRLSWNKKKQYHSKFSKKGDYEDVAIVGEQVFILKSNGILYSFPFADVIYEELDSVKEWKHLLPQGEYESLYGDDATGKLYVLCKNCVDDNTKDRVSGYILQMGDSLFPTGNFGIDVNEIKSMTDKVTRGFRPSALARNTISNEWYIVSAINKLMVVTDSSWKVKEICALNSNSFNQPEGIAFDNLGNLYISNEGDDFTEGNILKFTRKIQ